MQTPTIKFGQDAFSPEALQTQAGSSPTIDIDVSEIAEDFDDRVAEFGHNSSHEQISVFKRDGVYYALLGKEKLKAQLAAGQAAFKVKLLTKHALKKAQTLAIPCSVQNARARDAEMRAERESDRPMFPPNNFRRNDSNVAYGSNRNFRR